jgi:glycosyltransferase involved in cell wall biosynthesis
MHPSFALCFEGRLKSELSALGASLHQLPPVRLRKPQTVLHARRALKLLLEGEPFDVLVCHQPWTCTVFGGTVRDAGFPLVLWLHMAGDGRHWLERLARRTGPDLAICNSRFSAGRAGLWLTGTRTEQVYYPVSAASLYSTAERLSVRAALTTSPEDVVVIQVSRLEAWKGQKVLLTALAQLRDVSGWTCWIVGGSQRPAETDYFQELQNTAQEAGIRDRIRFIGERQDVSSVLRAADVFCQPNTEPEPFGLSLVEALETGLPVVTSGVGGASEIVDSTCGLLVPPGDDTALASALHRLVTDLKLRTGLGAAAPRRARTLCDPAQQLCRIQEVLSSVVRPALTSVKP